MLTYRFKFASKRSTNPKPSYAGKFIINDDAGQTTLVCSFIIVNCADVPLRYLTKGPAYKEESMRRVFTNQFQDCLLAFGRIWERMGRPIWRRVSEGIDDVKALRLLPSSDHVNFKVAMSKLKFQSCAIIQTFFESLF